MAVNYAGKVRTKHKLTGKIKYFDSVEGVTDDFEIVSICREPAAKTSRKTKNRKINKKLVIRYRDLYKNLIRYRLKNPLKEIGDNEVQQHHHILPKSIFGQNDKIILLTISEHCLAHYYLWKMYNLARKEENASKMCSAFNSLKLACGIPGGIAGMKQFYYMKNQIEKTFADV